MPHSSISAPGANLESSELLYHILLLLTYEEYKKKKKFLNLATVKGHPLSNNHNSFQITFGTPKLSCKATPWRVIETFYPNTRLRSRTVFNWIFPLLAHCCELGQTIILSPCIFGAIKISLISSVLFTGSLCGVTVGKCMIYVLRVCNYEHSRFRTGCRSNFIMMCVRIYDAFPLRTKSLSAVIAFEWFRRFLQVRLLIASWRKAIGITACAIHI